MGESVEACMQRHTQRKEATSNQRLTGGAHLDLRGPRVAREPLELAHDVRLAGAEQLLAVHERRAEVLLHQRRLRGGEVAVRGFERGAGAAAAAADPLL